MPSLDRLAQAIGHEFADPSHLQTSVIHRSFVAENSDRADNERHEFLGDAVLQLVVTDFLFQEFPELPEGKMAKVRAACVNRDILAEVARGLRLGEYLHLGRGEVASGGRTKDSILADAMEAVIAAVYLDGGLEATRRMVLAQWEPIIVNRAVDPGQRDYKTRLQEVLALNGERPRYDVSEQGPDHAKEFTAEVVVAGDVAGTGSGRSKKEAEQAAAEEALRSL